MRRGFIPAAPHRRRQMPPVGIRPFKSSRSASPRGGEHTRQTNGHQQATRRLRYLRVQPESKVLRMLLDSGRPVDRAHASAVHEYIIRWRHLELIDDWTIR